MGSNGSFDDGRTFIPLNEVEALHEEMALVAPLKGQHTYVIGASSDKNEFVFPIKSGDLGMTPTAKEIADFLSGLLEDGRLHPADIEILKAHARLPNRSGENWQIAEAATEGVVEQWSLGLEERVQESIPRWNQPPSWHAADCLQRCLGHAFAQKFPYYASKVQERSDHTKRWWMALGEAVETIDGKCTAVQLRAEIAEALDIL